MDESDAFRLQHGRKVNFFDCHWGFLPFSHEFRGDKELFKKGKSIRKGPPKWMLRVDIAKMLGELKESQDGGFEGYDEKHNWTQLGGVFHLPMPKPLPPLVGATASIAALLRACRAKPKCRHAAFTPSLKRHRPVSSSPLTPLKSTGIKAPLPPTASPAL
jgi:hypothetical protein